MRRWLLDVTRRPVTVEAVPDRLHREAAGAGGRGSMKFSDDFGGPGARRARRGDAHALIRHGDTRAVLACRAKAGA